MRADWSARPAGRYVNIRKAPGLDPKPRISRKRLDAWLKSDVLRPILAAPRMSVCHFCRSCSRLAVVFPRPGTERPFARLKDDWRRDTAQPTSRQTREAATKTWMRGSNQLGSVRDPR